MYLYAFHTDWPSSLAETENPVIEIALVRVVHWRWVGDESVPDLGKTHSEIYTLLIW